MTKDANSVREEYLARLDAAMRDLPHGVAVDIRGGIVEELTGLDEAATSVRIAQLGSPEEIARGAQEAIPSGSSETAPPVVVVPVPAAPDKGPMTGTRGFAIVAALVLGFGGVVLPVIGWAVGAVLVMLSPLWRTWEKAIAILLPFLTLALMALFGALLWSVGSDSGSGDGVANPLAPHPYSFGLSGVWATTLIIVPVSGIWLLWRLRVFGKR